MLGFIGAFMTISTIFLFNKVEEQEQLPIKIALHGLTFFFHLLFVMIIYYLR
ncbi:hypothetical protein STRDD13_00377 [Streptococcus sp. DD13]|nr:hypothetical protein STRDD13_00377 [Streptococcus sp. DD13]